MLESAFWNKEVKNHAIIKHVLYRRWYNPRVLVRESTPWPSHLTFAFLSGGLADLCLAIFQPWINGDDARCASWR
jgi:hypothetical protein